MKKNPKSHSRPRDERAQPTATRQTAGQHGHPLARLKPEDRAHPAERKTKHKHRPEDS